MIADEPWDRQNCAMCPEDIMFRVFRGNFAAKNMVSKDHTDEHNARASEPSNNINFRMCESIRYLQYAKP